MAKKRAGNQQAPSEQAAPQSSSLIISRNKHWRYISSFHGPWLQLPPEVLESLANQNFAMPAPRLIDPAVFYDIVKIRKAVDSAAEDAVRASTGISNNAMSGRMDYFGAGGGPSSQLSKERIFKIRQKAVKMLSKAFAADEVAASVATMQATSTVEDVALHVLKREPNNIDAKYAHFFHEKIPSRAMEQYTPLEPLDQVIAALPLEHQPPPLRTRAIVQMFKREWAGAAEDLSTAIRITQELKLMHKPNQQQLELASKMREEQDAWHRGYRDWRSIPQLKEEDQPSGLEQQLLFNRAGVYLTIACHGVDAALDGLREYQEAQENGELDDAHVEAHEARLAARKVVKLNARRALKDYAAFLSNLDYTPGLSYEVTNEAMRRMHDLANGSKTQTATAKNRLIELDGNGEGTSEDGDVDDQQHDGQTHANGNQNGSVVKHAGRKQDGFDRDGWPRFQQPKIHPVSALFAEKQPPDLPPFPKETKNGALHEAFASREAVTYHPLMTDAMHSLLLAHSLLQTSPTELLRHAHNVGRLARIADGYPLFQSARSPARADWMEVLRRANNWIGLSTPWQKLCKPAPLPTEAGGWAKDGTGPLAKRRQQHEETADQKRERIKQESIIDALSDDRVVDEDSFQRAVRARERRAMEDEAGISGPLKDKAPAAIESPPSTTPTTPTAADSEGSSNRHPQRWAQEENGHEYPISTERAAAIARWIGEAPLSMGPNKKKKKRPGRPKKSVAVNGIEDHMGSVQLVEEEDGPD